MEQAARVSYPPGALIRVKDICRNKKTGQPGLLPIDPATWYGWLKAGKVPPGRRLGPNTVAWPVEVVLAVGQQPRRQAEQAA